MENEKRDIHQLKLADLRAKLRTAELSITSLKNTHEIQLKEQEERLLAVQKETDEFTKGLRAALEDERKKSRRELSKQEKTIKELEKQLAEEKETNKALQLATQESRRALSNIEGKYKFEMGVHLEQKEEEHRQQEVRYREHAKAMAKQLQAAQADSERRLQREVASIQAKHAAWAEEMKAKHEQSLHETHSHHGSITDELQAQIIILTQALDRSKQDIEKYKIEKDKLLRHYESALAEKEKAHSEELDRVALRVKQAINKKDTVIHALKAELAAAHNRLL